MPKVSVLLTSYNYEKFLGESVKSVLSQTFSDLELIVVDDCSKDNSLKILQSFEDDRLIIIKNDRNMGQEYAFELINTLAKGEYIAIADADCRWLPEKLKSQVEYLDSHPECAAVFTKANFIDEEGRLSKTKAAENNDIFDVSNRKRHEWLHRFFYEGNCLCNPSVLIRRDVYKECYSSANGMWSLQDMYKWIRLLFKYEIHILDDRFVDFRLHKSNMSGPYNVKCIMQTSNEMYQIYDEYFNMSVPDFITAFPEEAKKYTINRKLNLRFALSRMLLENEHPAAKALALNKLFEILNDPIEKSEVSELYDYNNISYKDDITTYIPYLSNSLMGITKEYHPKLYFDFGNGYDEPNSIGQSTFAGINGAFSFVFSDLDKFLSGRKLSALRFDPHDSFIKIKIDRIICDDTEIEFKPEGGRPFFTQNNGYDIFYTDDPHYLLLLQKDTVKNIIIEGEIFDLEPSVLASTINNVFNSLSETVNQLNQSKSEVENLQNIRLDLNSRLADLNSRLAATQSELHKTTDQLNLVVNSFSWKITRPVRDVKKVVKKLLRK